jgi:hypothetical protein
MTHITLNTGDSYDVPAFKVRPDVVRVMRQLLSGGNLGTVAPAFSAFRVEVTREPGAAVFTVYRGREPLVMNMIAWEASVAERAWKPIEQQYLTLSDQWPQLMAAKAAPEMPAAPPWLATLILPGMGNLIREDVSWLADFEQCMACMLMTEGKR